MMNVILSAAKDLTVGMTVLLYLMISDEEKMRGLMSVAGFAGLRYKKNARLENLSPGCEIPLFVRDDILCF